MPDTFLNFIDGKWQPATNGGVFPDVNPANTKEVLGEFPTASKEDVGAAVEAAAKAYPQWSGTPMPERGQILRQAARILEERAEEVAETLTREMGKTLGESAFEVQRTIDIIRYYAGETMQPSGEVYPSTLERTFLYADRVPVGIVAVITPWNFPLAIPAWKIAPALAFGNTVVFKPSELAPVTPWHLVESLEKAGLPPGALNLVFGKGSEAGHELVENPRINAITFTGSNSVGSRIAASGAGRGAKVQLEMGGKNAIIIAPDADLDKAIEHTVAGSMLLTGQKCSSTSRAIVDRSLLPEFRERLVERVKSLRVGDGLRSDTYMGPLISSEAVQKVLRYIDLGKTEGARLLLGGDKLRGAEYDDGYFVAPTIFDRVTPQMRIAQEEIFGPVVGIIEATDFDDAIRLANETRFGLIVSLVTRDLELAMRFVREAKAGIVRVNSQTSGAELQVPFGGFKASGLGTSEQGKAAREFFTQTKTVYIDPS